MEYNVVRNVIGTHSEIATKKSCQWPNTFGHDFRFKNDICKSIFLKDIGVNNVFFFMSKIGMRWRRTQEMLQTLTL